jgi:DNA polymerase III epsilon subunit-like protein
MFDGAGWSEEAYPVHGISREEAEDSHKMSEKELVIKFLAWANTLSDTTMMGENPSFDRDFIRLACVRYHLDWKFAYRTIDLHSIACAHFLREGRTIPTKNKHSDLGLDAILPFVGLPSNPKPHNALRDVYLEAECFSRIIHGKNLLPEFEVFGIPAHLTTKSG